MRYDVANNHRKKIDVEVLALIAAFVLLSSIVLLGGF